MSTTNNTKVVKIRIGSDLNDIVNTLAYKLCAEKSKVVTNKDVLNAIFTKANINRNSDLDEVVQELKDFV
jgi:hypothetical protein